VITPEFSRPVAVDHLAAHGKSFDIVANAAERRALAERYKIIAVDSLLAHIELSPLGRAGGVRLTGRFEAVVVQSCVVTLEPVAARVDEEFTLTYAEAPPEIPGEIVVAIDQEDPPEPLVDGHIDIGEATAEHVALALDPFPRVPGAVFESPGEEPETTDAPVVSPFAALTALVKKSGP
jgi:uncharacterized metal-binding protein YceD (DUF177 family)